MSSLVECIECWEDHVDEIVRSVTVLETSLDTVIVHCLDEILELLTSQKTVAIGISSSKSAIDLSPEFCALLLASLHLLSVTLAGSFLLLGEGGLPCDLISDEGCEKLLEASLLGSHLLFRS